MLLDNGERLMSGDLQLPGNGVRVVCGIRPEDFAVTASGNGALAFDVSVVEPTGAETIVFGRAAGSPVTAIFRERRVLEPGERLQLNSKVIHLFDTQTEQRIALSSDR